MDWEKLALQSGQYRLFGRAECLAHFCRVSTTWGSNRSFAVAGSFSLLACSSSPAAFNIVSRSLDTSSSAALSKKSSSFLRFFCLFAFFGFRMASIFMSS